MPAADGGYFSREHLETHRFAASATLAEQAVHCLELVAQLSAAGLSYQFKGGNSLLLILERPRRFSIDVDIATGQPRERIEETLDTIVREGEVFTRWEGRPHKTKPWLPIASYYLYYRSSLATGNGGECSIMLDAQLRRSPYPTPLHPVVCGELYRSEVCVELPTPAALVGDKLLTIGPSTLGIPLGKGKEAQRLKHVFDISSLLAGEPALDDIRSSFCACLEHENELQERKVRLADVLQDTLIFCGSVGYHPAPPGESGNRMLDENVRGLADFAAHLFDSGYDWHTLQLDMSRVALCISAVGTPDVCDARFQSALAGTTGTGGQLESHFLLENPRARANWRVLTSWLGYNPLVAPR